MSVGSELLNVPFGDMVRSLAMAIADGQRALDRSSVDTARMLAQERIDLIEEMHEIISPRITDVPLGDGQSIRITGATIDATSTPPKSYTLMQAGLFPTFYQFTESIIEVKMSISQRTSRTREIEAGASVSGGWGPVSFAAHVNFKTSQTYSYSVEGSSLLRTTLKPVPPPARLNPRIITVNTLPTLLGQPPTVTTG